MPPDNEDAPQPSKRRKVAESCKVCRAKKTRCDGQRPVCSPCATKSLTCEYNEGAVPVATSVLSTIEERLQRLEHQATETRGQILSRGRAQRDSFPGEPSNPSAGGQDPGSDVSLADYPTTQYIRDITQLANAQSTAQSRPPYWVDTTSWPLETDASFMVVPKRTTADDLLACYENNVYPLLPTLHMPTFRSRYECLWEARRDGQFATQAEETSFHATLNIVFALGCLNNSKIEPQLKLRTADGFYRRARAILPLDALDVPSLGVVQYLLLTVNYLTFTKHTHRICHVLAVAVRISETLGLHGDVESLSNNQLKREMSRRVWHLCLTLERLVSSLFGPQTVPEPKSHVPLPSCIDDEYLLEDSVGMQPVGVPSIIDAFVVSIEIFEVIEGARKVNYGSFTRGLRLPELTEVLQLNDEIDQIENSLPDHLKHDDHANLSTPRDRVLKIQAEIVMIRILHLRLVLLRPNVLATARRSIMSSTADPVMSRTEIALGNEVSTICVQAAVAAIRTLHANLQFTSSIFSSNAVSVTLAAATVIVAASLLPELDVSLDDRNGPYCDVMAKALQVLDEHRWQVEGVPRSRDELEKFIETVNQAKRRREHVNQPLDGASQAGSGQLPSEIEETIGDLDFSDPLWSFPWNSSTPMFNLPGPCFDWAYMPQPI